MEQCGQCGYKPVVRAWQVMCAWAPYLSFRLMTLQHICLGLARTIYIRFIYGIFGRESTKYTVIYGVYIRFWPTLHMFQVLMSMLMDAELKRSRLVPFLFYVVALDGGSGGWVVPQGCPPQKAYVPVPNIKAPPVLKHIFMHCMFSYPYHSNPNIRDFVRQLKPEGLPFVKLPTHQKDQMKCSSPFTTVFIIAPRTRQGFQQLY